MKKIILISALGFLTTGTALGADLVYVPPVVNAGVIDAGFDWSGFYAGVHGGYASGNSDIFFGFPGFPVTTFDENIALSGGFGGIHAGANFQSGAFVGGIEGLLDYIPITGQDTGIGGDVNRFEGQFMGTLGVRAGFAVDTALFYVSGGVAALSGTGRVLDVGEEESVNHSFLGGTVGAGAEMALTDNITARLDYRYYAFGAGTSSYPINGYDLSFTPRFHTVSAGVSFKF